ncbi:MAG: GAF domain-containing protein [Ignavibacteriales bacterium]|nr:MAG: GAF domain-containing protein [Ignavibacteriales bacterium]
MAEAILVNKDSSLEEQYSALLPQIKSLVNSEENFISNLSNFTAILKQSFEKISWVGFYLFDGRQLYLGPFQGKVACTTIEIGKGVCGKAAEDLKTIIVPDVNKFPGHIFCDVDSKSEIVIPLLKNGKLLGVLDLDSNQYDSFNEIDSRYLNEMCIYLSENIFN